jgi:hypothetical protein
MRNCSCASGNSPDRSGDAFAAAGNENPSRREVRHMAIPSKRRDEYCKPARWPLPNAKDRRHSGELWGPTDLSTVMGERSFALGRCGDIDIAPRNITHFHHKRSGVLDHFAFPHRRFGRQL